MSGGPFEPSDLDAVLPNGKTKLIEAVEAKDHAATRKLLTSRASPNAAAKDGQTALIVACKANNEDLVSLLLTARAMAREGASRAMVSQGWDGGRTTISGQGDGRHAAVVARLRADMWSFSLEGSGSSRMALAAIVAAIRSIGFLQDDTFLQSTPLTAYSVSWIGLAGLFIVFLVARQVRLFILGRDPSESR